MPYWTMSGRIGAWNTSGRGCDELEGLPSAAIMVTVGLEDILPGDLQRTICGMCGDEDGKAGDLRSFLGMKKSFSCGQQG